MGSESTNCDVGAGLLYQVALWPFAGQLSSNLMKSVCRSDWKFVTPLAEFGEFQLTPTEGSPASCAVYSTVCTVGPWLLSVTSTSVPGASKFWNPIFGPRSRGAAGANAVPAEADTGLALPEYWKPAKALKYTTCTENCPVPTSGLLGSRSTTS